MLQNLLFHSHSLNAFSLRTVCDLCNSSSSLHRHRQTDFQAQRAAFAILATHLPARNFATLRRIALFFHSVHLHPSVFIKAGIPIESALLRPYWKDVMGSGRDGQLRLEASAKMSAFVT